MARIYLISQRKHWHHTLPEGWIEIAFERFDYVECGIFEKSDNQLTEDDKELVRDCGNYPEGWISPSSYKEETPDVTTVSQAAKRANIDRHMNELEVLTVALRMQLEKFHDRHPLPELVSDVAKLKHTAEEIAKVFEEIRQLMK